MLRRFRYVSGVVYGPGNHGSIENYCLHYYYLNTINIRFVDVKLHFN